MTEAQEKKNRRIALITSLGVHGLVVLILLFIVAWRAPNPPLPEYGIELNFGTDLMGGGAVQPRTPVAAAESEEEEVQEEVVEDLPVPDPEEVTEEEVVEEPSPAQVESVQPEVTAKTESPVVVEEKKEVKPAESPREKPAEKKEEPKPVPKAVYKPKAESGAGKQNQETADATSHGDDPARSGDKGDRQGNVDAKALYGKQGGGGGGVSMSGFGTFGYPDINTPDLPKGSTGTYEFKVQVDEQGYVTRVEIVQRGSNIEAERRLRATIQNLQFIPKGNPQPAEGTITFRVVAE